MPSCGDSLRIALRADGDDLIGAGHVARCLPLARALADLGHRPTFVGSYTGLAAELLREADLPHRPADLHSPVGVSPAEIDAAIVDSYTITSEEICELASRRAVATIAEARRCRGSGVLVDYHLDRLGEIPTERLLPGPAYAPVDPRFAIPHTHGKKIERVLVSAGGGDTGTPVLTSAITAVRDVFPEAVILATHNGGLAIDGMELLPRGSRLWEVTQDVDLAVSAAGITAYELACAGVPSVLVAIAENQLRVSRSCADAGIALSLDAFARDFHDRLRSCLRDLRDPSRRAGLAARGSKLVDGRGAARIATALAARWRQ